MRIEQVTAYAFGPLSEETLELAPGMTVVHGGNEAGKSSWHAAIYAGLCGLRRGRGAKTREDRDFTARHRPRDGMRWEAGVTLALRDGRRLELRHDLDGLVDCQATDLTLGRDVSDELQHDGTPDGALLLGLTRRTLPPTICVRQADLLGVLHAGEDLQEALQRAAATAGTDATAEQALERLAAFRREHIGVLRANSTKPLMAATRDADAAGERLEQARAARVDHDRLVARQQDAHTALDDAERALARARTARDRRLLAALERRLAEARELAQRFADGPPPPVGDDDALERRVANALAAYEVRPPLPAPLTGPTSAELAEQLETVPPPGDGDVEVHDEVATAARAWERAVQAEEQTGERPADRGPHRLLGGAAAAGLGSLVAAGLGATTPAGIVGLVALALALAAIAAARRAGRQRAEAAVSAANRAQAAVALTAALADRGQPVDPDTDLAGLLDDYERACRANSARAAAAERRASLHERLEARLAAEGAAEEQTRRRRAAEQPLCELATQVGAAAADAADAAAQLRAWQEQRSRARRAAVADREAWQRLQHLLDERTLVDLEAEARQLRQRCPPEQHEGGDAALCDHGDGDQRDADVVELERRIREAAETASRLDGQVAESARTLPNVAEAEEELEQANTTLERLRGLDATLQTVERLLADARDSLYRSVAPRLQEALERRLAAITGGRYHEALVDPATLAVEVRGPDGRWQPATGVSHGTAEQIYLLLRLAMAEHLVTTGEPAPLLLDDVTVQSDPHRTTAVLELLHDVSRERQIVLFSQEPDVLAWAEQHLRGGDDALVRLATPAAPLRRSSAA